MTTDEYWNASPSLAWAYREAHKLKRRQENSFAWLQGVYVCAALSATVCNMFLPKGAKRHNYYEKPVDLGLETEAEKEDRAIREREKIIANLTNWKRMWDAQHKSGENT